MKYPLVGDVAPGPVHLTANPAPSSTPQPVYVGIAATGDIVAVTPQMISAIDAITELDRRQSIQVTELSHDERLDNPAGGSRRAQIALTKAGLADFVERDTEEWLGLSLEDAHARLLPYLEPLLGQESGGHDVVAYETPLGTVDAILGQNYKTGKSAPPGERPSLVMGLSLLPADKLHHYRQLDPRGRVRRLVEDQLPDTAMSTFCAGSNAHCREACLVFTGRNPSNIYNHRRKAALSIALLRDPGAFCRLLVEAIRRHIRHAKHQGVEPLVRLNVLSDIPWELVLGHVMQWHAGEVQFYDYTKVAGRRPPDNYDLTFSYSGTNQQDAVAELERGRRVAVVFLGMRKGARGAWQPFRQGAPLPATFWGLPVVDGDISDLRPRDPTACIVGLRWKTPAGQMIDPTTEFAFVEPAYVVAPNRVEVGPRKNPADDELELLVVPVTPRYQDIEAP